MSEVPIVGESTEARVKKFQEGIEKLIEEHQIAFRPQIGPDGPFNTFIDLKTNEKQDDKATK